MFKEFLMKKMLEKQMKGVPPEQVDKMVEVVMKNPDYFKQLGEKIKSRQANGKDQTTATMEVMMEEKEVLQKLMGDGGVHPDTVKH